MHKRALAGFLAAAFMTLAAHAAGEVPLNPAHPDRYVVKRGDTLWDIAERFLRDPWLWPEVWHINPQIENPHLIYPGDVISLVYVDGKPRLVLQRGRPTVKLSPQARPQPLDEAIPTIPLDVIGPFLSRPRVLEEPAYERAPYIVSSADEHLIAGAGDRVYVRGLSRGPGRYTVLRRGELYRDPDTGEVLGLEAVHVADARLQRPGDPAVLVLVSSSREAIVGDRVLPVEEGRYTDRFLPRAPKHRVDGRIISVLDGVSRIGQYQVVVLNRGRREGVEPGHVLAVYQTGEVIEDPVRGGKVKLPDERAGIVMVFRTFDKVSYALVMRATRSIRVLDRVRNP